MHAGDALIPVRSRLTNCHRPCRGGNRQLDAAVHGNRHSSPPPGTEAA
jgi:hypothetical protein